MSFFNHPKYQAGPQRVQILRGHWIDDRRDRRKIPYKIFYPGDLNTPAPVVVWSHGLGSTCDTAGYLGKHLASHGYAAVHIQHIDSDDSAWRDSDLKPMDALKNFKFTPEISINRFDDVPFVLDQLPSLDINLDINAIGMSGHSYGALSTLVAAGMPAILKNGKTYAHVEKRFKAAIAYSPPSARGATNIKAHYKDIKIPMLHMTGTKDGGVLWDMDYTERFAAFENIEGADQYLLALEDGDHFVFAGMPFRKDAPKDETHHQLICFASTLFWDAYLKDDIPARALLQDSEFADLLENEAEFRAKL